MRGIEQSKARSVGEMPALREFFAQPPNHGNCPSPRPRAERKKVTTRANKGSIMTAPARRAEKKQLPSARLRWEFSPPGARAAHRCAQSGGKKRGEIRTDLAAAVRFWPLTSIHPRCGRRRPFPQRTKQSKSAKPGERAPCLALFSCSTMSNLISVECCKCTDRCESIDHRSPKGKRMLAPHSSHFTSPTAPATPAPPRDHFP